MVRRAEGFDVGDRSLALVGGGNLSYNVEGT